MLHKDAFKNRRFRIWGACLIVLLSAFTLFVTHVASRPSEPFVSVRFGQTNLSGTPVFSIEVSNRMSFNVDYFIVAEELRSETGVTKNGWLYGTYRGTYRTGYSITGHAQKREALIGPSKGATWTVSFQRQLKPIEVSVLNKLPWLKKHYPFQRRRSFLVYAISDVQVSSETKQQP
jgi:hypothetical protein